MSRLSSRSILLLWVREQTPLPLPHNTLYYYGHVERGERRMGVLSAVPECSSYCKVSLNIPWVFQCRMMRMACRVQNLERQLHSFHNTTKCLLWPWHSSRCKISAYHSQCIYLARTGTNKGVLISSLGKHPQRTACSTPICMHCPLTKQSYHKFWCCVLYPKPL